MTVVVSRHFAAGVTEEEWVESLGEYLTEDIDELEQYPHSLGRVFNSALLHLGARCTVDPRAAKLETWEAVVNTLQLGSAVFATASAEEGSVECMINRQVRTLPATSDEAASTDLGTWLSTFWLAVVCRDQTRLTELCRFPLDRLDASGFEEYVLHWVDTLQTYWLQGPGLVEKLTRAVEMSSPDVAVQVPRAMLEGVLAPPINLFYLFITQDVEGFNKALVHTLELHKAYWTADERSEKPAGHLALAPLAMACFAFDGKMPVQVESGYLPHHLLHRSWLGEFPT
ncbi:immunity 49 family protein [Streptomyces sp. NBC_01426]|uniref:immunity 49 family protein n=1 Tax=Streptomyces sp. NBC_01426 TaxID=2975866 RepID=UPI002E3582DE|nr:immunity 49 family protein [Streptomyces sp. NBC_01426]